MALDRIIDIQYHRYIGTSCSYLCNPCYATCAAVCYVSSNAHNQISVENDRKLLSVISMATWQPRFVFLEMIGKGVCLNLHILDFAPCFIVTNP